MRVEIMFSLNLHLRIFVIVSQPKKKQFFKIFLKSLQIKITTIILALMIKKAWKRS